MELVTLNSSFQAAKFVENYESLIWTERYATNGDFELKGSNIAELMALLPLESYVSLRESPIPMVVEGHKIEKKKNAGPVLTVLGRSFETVLERRAAVRTPLAPSTVRDAWMVSASTGSDAAYNAMRRVLGDFPRYQNGTAILSLTTPAVDPNDAIPEIDLVLPADYKIAAWSNAIPYLVNDRVGYNGVVYEARALTPNLNKQPDTQPTYWNPVAGVPGYVWGASNIVEIPPKDLYNAVIELIATNHHGFKAVRPDANGTKIGIEIYNGADLTESVVFDARFDQIDDATYLLSRQGSADVAYVYGPNGGSMVARSTGATYSGLSRRVLLLDAVSDTSVSTADARNSRGLIELYQNNPTALFDGEVAQQVANGYNRDYFLGDIIKLNGEYGLSEIVRVSEFIRSADGSGEKAYPTFETVT